MSGKLYAVGVGPGDPELITLKALKIIKSVDCIACPESHGEPGLAYAIAKEAVPEIVSKEVFLLDFPMRKEGVSDAHKKAADQVMAALSAGKNVAFLTLGDPGVYSTFYYIADAVMAPRFEVEVVGGITSFSAAAARLKLPLSLGAESVMITSGKFCEFDGTLVILKAGSRLKEIKAQVAAAGKSIYLVENCGMADEKIVDSLDSMPDEAGYFSLVIVK